METLRANLAAAERVVEAVNRLMNREDFWQAVKNVPLALPGEYDDVRVALVEAEGREMAVQATLSYAFSIICSGR